MTNGSRFGTNLHPVTVCLTVGATILYVTAVLAPSTNFTLTTVGAQNTGSATAGIQAIGGPLMARGANIMCTMAEIPVTGKRLVEIKRTSVATITLNRNRSLTHSLRL